jgi:hypothetical protein
MKKYNLTKKTEHKSNEIRVLSHKKKYGIAYKNEIIAKADLCKAKGELGSLLRREGLASSTLHGWREAKANGNLRASFTSKRGPHKLPVDKAKVQINKLEKENYYLKKRLEQAEAIIDLQKKISQILNLDLAKDNVSKQ